MALLDNTPIDQPGESPEALIREARELQRRRRRQRAGATLLGILLLLGGGVAHADVNAARVILARALDNLAGGPSVTARGGLQAKQAGSAKREPTRQQAIA